MRNNLKNSFHSKKGVSLVVCIALSIVLFMTTATFISIALLQQNDTNSQLNTRQAYISAKSAMDTAKEMLENNDKLDAEQNFVLPDNEDDSYFYVMYNDSGSVKVKSFNSNFEDCKAWLKTSTEEVIGDSYIKITKTSQSGSTSSYTATAVSIVDKYSVDDSERQGDLSIDFIAETEYKSTKDTKKSTLYVKKPTTTITTPPPSPGNDFLMAGSQTNYSLLYSYLYSSPDRTNSNYNLLAEYQNENSQSLMAINRETGDPKDNKYLINSQFPIIYYQAAYGNTDNSRETYTAYNQGVFFLGNFSSEENRNWRKYQNGVKNAAYVTVNTSFTSTYNCKYVVIGNNMYAMSDYTYPLLTVNYSGSENSDYVYVYIAKDNVKFTTINDNGTEIGNFTMKKGWYKVSTGSDLFSQSSYSSVDSSVDLTSTTTYVDNIYNQVSKNQIHSACEQNVSNAVDILYLDGKFSNSSNSYSTSQRTLYTDGWANYSIYCAPNFMPSSPSSGTAYYDMYSGKSGTDGSFNFCWYNVNDAVINQNVNMSIHSSSIVLTIGPETEEVVGIKNNGSSGTYATSSIGNTGFNAGTTKQASNTIVGEKNSSFWLKPYWGESSATVTVKSTFTVKYDTGNGNYETYTVAPGNYSIENNTNGVNLFSDEGKKLFGSTQKVKEDLTVDDIDWVEVNGSEITIHQFTGGTSPDPKNDDGVLFTANSGSLSQNAVYSAESITASFTGSANPLETNNAKLQAKYISIGSGGNGTLTIQGTDLGTAFYINSYSGNINYQDFVNGNEYDGAFYELDDTGNQVKGVLLHFADDVILNNSASDFSCELKAGYYFFTSNMTYDNSVDILNPESWKNVYYYSSTAADEIKDELNLTVDEIIKQDSSTGEVTFSAGEEFSLNQVTKVSFGESRYY